MVLEGVARARKVVAVERDFKRGERVREQASGRHAEVVDPVGVAGHVVGQRNEREPPVRRRTPLRERDAVEEANAVVSERHPGRRHLERDWQPGVRAKRDRRLARDHDAVVCERRDAAAVGAVRGAE